MFSRRALVWVYQLLTSGSGRVYAWPDTFLWAVCMLLCDVRVQVVRAHVVGCVWLVFGFGT